MSKSYASRKGAGATSTVRGPKGGNVRTRLNRAQVTLPSGKKRTIKIGDTIKVYSAQYGGSIPIRVASISSKGYVTGKLARAVKMSDGSTRTAGNSMGVTASPAEVRRGMSGK